jgi:signal transduction histidine kinase
VTSTRMAPVGGVDAPVSHQAVRRVGGVGAAGLMAAGLMLVVVAEWVYYVGLTKYAALPALQAMADGAVALSYILLGIFTWRRRPDSWTGAEMYLAGCLFLIGNFGNTNLIGIHHAGIAFEGLGTVAIGIVVLGYPTGRLRDPAARRLALFATTWVVVTGIITVTQLDPTGCPPEMCPSNPFAWPLGTAFTDAFWWLTLAVEVLLWAAFAALVARRWWGASATARRSLRPLWTAAILVAVARLVGPVITLLLGPEVADQYSVWVAVPLLIAIPAALAYGLVRGRLEQASVSDLVIRLGGRQEDVRLPDAIARALGDPTAVLAFPTPEGPFVDGDGRQVELGGAERRATPIDRDGTTIAVLIHDASLDANPALVRSVGAAAGLALENERLAAEVQTQLEAVRASRARIVEASDAERARIERDLHDGAQQRLVALTLQLRTRAATAGDPAVAAAFDAAADDLDEALSELRELARGIHPTSVVQGGLAGATEALAERATIPVTVSVPRDRWPLTIEVAAFFVIAEALTNATRYARAAQVAVDVVDADGRLTVQVSDDGVGGAHADGAGLTGLADRVAALDGRFDVVSPVGGGTTVRASFPLTPP